MWRQRLPGRGKRRRCRYGAIAGARLAIGLILFSVDSVDGRRGGVRFGIWRIIGIWALMGVPEVFQWLGLGRVLDQLPILGIECDHQRHE